MGAIRPIDERLQKYLARTGIASRRRCEEFIAAGRVMVNGETVTEMGTTVGPGDVVGFDGKPVEPQPFEYHLLNKPAGVVSAVSDPHGRKTVVEIVPSGVRLFPVGRLDFDTTGLIILTNDGGLAHRLMHPGFEVDKVYRAEVKGAVTEKELERLRRGIRLEDGPTAPAEARIIAGKGTETTVEIVIHQGRKRQVRRMMESIGHPVSWLHRSRYGLLADRGLKPGKSRPLTREEVKALKKLTAGGAK